MRDLGLGARRGNFMLTDCQMMAIDQARSKSPQHRGCRGSPQRITHVERNHRRHPSCYAAKTRQPPPEDPGATLFQILSRANRQPRFRMARRIKGVPDGTVLVGLCQTRMTRMSLLVNAATTSSEAPASVTSTSTSSMGQINDGVTTPSLVESATTITCLACLTMVRKVRVSSDSLVVAPRIASSPDTLRKTLSTNMSFRIAIEAGPISEKDHGQRT